MSSAAPVVPEPSETAAPAHAPAPAAAAPDEGVARAVADVREMAEARSSSRRSQGAWASELLLGGGFVLLCLVLAITWPEPSWRALATVALFGLAHGVASRVVFESSGGAAVPTAPIVAAAIFVAPLSLVPVIVLIGLLIGSFGSSGESGIHRLLVPALSGWNSLGPVLVLAVHGDHGADLRDWPWYAAALAAQCAIDSLVAVVRVRSLGMSWRVLPRPMAWTYLVDATLAPVGLVSVIACEGSLWSVLFASLPIGLLALLARDRAEHLEQAVVISKAFQDAMETARQDALTGIGNRRAWNEATTRAAVQFAADPVGNPVTVVLGDLDRLKTVNDLHGHDAGDELIRAAARIFADAAPAGSLVARLGGDEFGILVVGTAVQPAELVADLRQRMLRTPPVHGTPVSVSIGAASCPPLDDVEAALAAADSLAFADKAARRAGRA
ncbi:MAG: GGDEF domain-containing protein [Acidimicrobiales bacterium]